MSITILLIIVILLLILVLAIKPTNIELIRVSKTAKTIRDTMPGRIQYTLLSNRNQAQKAKQPIISATAAMA